MELQVFSKVRYRAQPCFLLTLPDGSRSRIPVAWTDALSGTAPASSALAAPAGLLLAAPDLLRLRQRVDFLLRRTVPAQDNVSHAEPNKHATTTTTTGDLVCRASSASSIYQALAPQQRSLLIDLLAKLMIQKVRNPLPGLQGNSKPSTSTHHEQ
jgi:hypothetical protein